ncbi:MAG TPA: rRNA maturation RNase YbeY [Gemmatimonadaceae bacterium]|nr:rRNA maturation RNase YbeY [Gemmatimonadaceae bacterium]
MSLAVDVSVDGRRSPLAAARVAEIARATLRAERVRDAMVSIALVPARAMAALNRRHLGRPGATDVIAFAFAPAGAAGPVVGDVYICPEVARANARAHGVGVREELARLVVHGTLHVLGYDHPHGEDRARSSMWQRQERLVGRALRRGSRS